jgi:hypothetical protein
MLDDRRIVVRFPSGTDAQIATIGLTQPRTQWVPGAFPGGVTASMCAAQMVGRSV